MYVKNGPNTRDAALLVACLFAAAAADAASDALDLGQAQITNPRFELEIQVPALPPLVDHSVTFKVQDSADGSTFADLGLSFTVAGVASTGTAAVTKRFGLASTTRQYIRVVATETSGGADITALKFSFQPVFWKI